MADASALREIAEGAGYTIRFRHLEWTDCLLQGAGERHQGSGQDEDDALRDALMSALPSALGRRLLESVVLFRACAVGVDRVAAGASSSSAPGVATSEGAPDAQPPSASTGDAPLTPSVPAAAVASPTAGATPAPESAPGPSALLDVVVAQPAAKVVEAATIPAVVEPAPLPPRTSEPATPPQAPPEECPSPSCRATPADMVGTPPRQVAVTAATVPRTPLSMARAVDALAELLARVNAESSLGALAPEWQRHRMLAWMCAGRALEERVADAEQMQVMPACARLARRLTALAKRFWPGSVRALQLVTMPADVRVELSRLGAPGAAAIRSWEDAARVASALLHQIEERAQAEGLDAYGWADRRLLTPPPTAAAARFAECVASLDRVLGRGVVALSEEVIETREARPPLLGSEVLEELLRVARLLRWLRAAVPDEVSGEAWGTAMGALRWAALGLDDRGRHRLGELLQPRYRPPTSWAALPAGDAPVSGSREAQRAELLKQLPAAAASSETLGRWLLAAFDAWSGPELAAVLGDAGSVVAAAVSTATYPDLSSDAARRCRRRHGALVELLRPHAPAAAAPPEPAPAGGDDADEVPVQEVERRAELVRPHVAGKRVLLVSNCEDRELGERVADLLGCKLTVKEATNRRLDAVAKQIAKGSYDVVLGVTGFQLHATDSKLQSACRGGGAKYVRVNRGRPLAIVQALSRDFGLTA